MPVVLPARHFLRSLTPRFTWVAALAPVDPGVASFLVLGAVCCRVVDCVPECEDHSKYIDKFLLRLFYRIQFIASGAELSKVGAQGGTSVGIDLLGFR